jgi:hypothetical protein
LLSVCHRQDAAAPENVMREKQVCNSHGAWGVVGLTGSTDFSYC